MPLTQCVCEECAHVCVYVCVCFCFCTLSRWSYLGCFFTISLSGPVFTCLSEGWTIFFKYVLELSNVNFNFLFVQMKNIEHIMCRAGRHEHVVNFKAIITVFSGIFVS